MAALAQMRMVPAGWHSSKRGPDQAEVAYFNEHATGGPNWGAT